MMVLRFLKWLTKIHLESPEDVSRPHLEFLRIFNYAADKSLDAFSILHKHGLWLPRVCAEYLCTCVKVVLRAYKTLAKKKKDMNRPGFKLKPKFHAFAHVAQSLQASLRCGSNLVLNPLAHANEQNEDTVGRLSKLSRGLDSRHITRRILERHFLKKKALLRRFNLRRGAKAD